MNIELAEALEQFRTKYPNKAVKIEYNPQTACSCFQLEMGDSDKSTHTCIGSLYDVTEALIKWVDNFELEKAKILLNDCLEYFASMEGYPTFSQPFKLMKTSHRPIDLIDRLQKAGAK